MSKQTLIDALTKEYKEAEELLEECIENDESEAVRYAVLNLKKAYESAINLVNEHLADDNWISVDDDLPNPEQEIKFLDDRFEPSRFYLIQLKDGFIDTAYFATICDDCEYNDIFISCTVNAKDNRYYIQERGFDAYAVYEVSHWQPLPQPTKG